MKKAIINNICVAFLLLISAKASAQVWVETLPEAKPYTRWWWLGSAVDKAGLDYNLGEYSKAGIGGVEITPIYGVKGNDANDIDYLSPRWMEMLSYIQSIAPKLGIEVNMATGTGWPFGGPNVPESEAACKLNVSQDGTISIGRTKQKVKRAAPGGDGWVIDHFDRKSVEHYLATFDKAFANSNTPYPHTFFNDSYEVYNADWTPTLLEEFKSRRGYSLEDHLKDFLLASDSRNNPNPTDIQHRIMSDYRETLSDLLYENFTTVWTDWAHKHGAITRNQAHGSPANLIDLYAEVDIPECEGFGLTDFGITGLRTDPGNTKENYSDLSMLKYASSGAHISGKKFTSSETFTWLTEHFRTSFSQCKPDFDLMMVSGVNHIFFHGSCYTPKDDPWPGWKFYASIDMSPTNNLWRDAPAFYKYIERTQAFMQYAEPDNDILVYLPFHDMIYEQPGRLVQFDIHSMAQRAPRFIKSISEIIHAGYDCDYISDRYVLKTNVIGADHQLTTTGRNRYSAILIPGVKFIPLATLQKLLNLSKSGAKVIFMGGMPESAPGLKGLEQQAEYDNVLGQLRMSSILTDSYEVLHSCAKPELMRTKQGLSCIRRADADCHYYFISNLKAGDVDEWITLGKAASEAVFCNPMNGKVTRARIRQNEEGLPEVMIQLRSGESIILVTSNNFNSIVRNFKSTSGTISIPDHDYLLPQEEQTLEIENWTLRFIQSAPEEIKDTYKLPWLKSWTELGDKRLTETMATGLYTTTFKIKTKDNLHYLLDLGDVRETARLRLNGQEVATLFAVPYICDVTEFIKSGTNKIEVEVSNLGANRIAKLDREGVEWRKFKEINVVDLNYKNTRYDKWQPMPSGLCSSVRIIPCTLK